MTKTVWTDLFKTKEIKNTIISTDAKEKQETKRSEKNIIISAIPLPSGNNENETNDRDKETVEKILKITGLTMNDNHKIRRLTDKQENNKDKRIATERILIELGTVEERDIVLKNSKNLKGSEYKIKI